MYKNTAKAILAVALASVVMMGSASAGDAEKGKKVYNKCKTCHIVEAEGPKKMGPSLHGIFGRTAGTVEGYKYSKNMAAYGVEWTDETLAVFLKDPRGTIKGTKMAFAGVKKDEQMADLLAYMAEATAAAE